jgi:2-iminobutanoate/2-iminopropanoate deaminase
MMKNLSVISLVLLFGGQIAFTQSGQITKIKTHGNQSQDTVYGYASVVKQGNTLYISGVTATGDFPSQVGSIYTSLENILKRQGASFQNVVKENLFTTSLDSMKKYAYIRKPFYQHDFPAASWIGVKELFTPDRMLEVELVAILPLSDPKLLIPHQEIPEKLILGSWQMNRQRDQILETWTKKDEHSMIGKSFGIANGNTTLQETVLWTKEADGIYYIPVTEDQNDQKPIRFKMTSGEKNRYVFENPAHDFPKRIVYDFKNEKILHAWIDGGPQDPTKRQDYYFHKIQ